ncbi:charged multivesicular body protein 7-like [Artemia franciscana]|uniref:charged multivesicular body protein 7-like n=1 Tax=Artemia franciscana TaxID=6661 RepID=UPI0032DA9E78
MNERLNKDYLPDSWNDETKISFLFEEPRSPSVNPLDAEHKYKFWSNAVKKWYETNNLSSFTFEDAKEAFRKRGRVPAYLGDSLSRMQREGILRNYSEFNEELIGPEGVSVTVTSRLFSTMLISPVKMGIATAKWALGYSQILPDATRFIAVETVQAKSKKIEQILKERPGLVVYTATSFWKDYNEIIKDEEEASLILSYLRKNSIVHITRDGDTYVVKVGAEENDTTTTPVKQKNVDKVNIIRSPMSSIGKPVTEAEKTIAKISTTLQLLYCELEKINDESQELKEKAVCALKEDRRDQAKMYLRKKRRLEALAEKRSAAVSQLEMLQESLIDADTNSMVLDTYKTVKDAFGTTLKAVSGYEDALEDLNEALQDHSHIAAALSAPLSPTEDMSSLEELEKELAQILEEGELPSPPLETAVTLPVPTKKEKGHFGLPDVPSTPLRGKETQIYDVL